MTFSDLVPSRDFAGEGKTGFEPSRTKFRCYIGRGDDLEVSESDAEAFWHAYFSRAGLNNFRSMKMCHLTWYP